MRNMDDIDDEVDEGVSEIDDVGIEELNDVSLTDLRWFRDALFIRISVNPTILFFKDYNNTDDPPDDDPPVDDQTDQWPIAMIGTEEFGPRKKTEDMIKDIF